MRLPDSYHKHDEQWLQETISQLPHSMHNQVCIKYGNTHKELLKEHDGRIEAENLARRECNIRLRKLVEKYANGQLGQAQRLRGE